MGFLPEISFNVFDIANTSSNVVAFITSYIAPKPLLYHPVPCVRHEAFERPMWLTHIISKKRFLC